MNERHKQEGIDANRFFNWFLNWFPGDSDICIGDRYKGLGKDVEHFLLMHHKAMLAEENEPSDDVGYVCYCCGDKLVQGVNYCSNCGAKQHLLNFEGLTTPDNQLRGNIRNFVEYFTDKERLIAALEANFDEELETRHTREDAAVKASLTSLLRYTIEVQGADVERTGSVRLNVVTTDTIQAKLAELNQGRE